MTNKEADGRSEMTGAPSRGSGRKPREKDVRASNVTARRETSNPESSMLMEAVVGSSNMRAAYRRVMRNKGAAGIDNMSVDQLAGHLREHWRTIRKTFIESLTPKLRGWGNYYKLAEVKNVFEDLDAWIRRRLRCILWRQWKRTYRRAKNLMKLGIAEERAWRSATNGRGPWWNSRASHMNQAMPKRYFKRRGLFSLLDQHWKNQCLLRTAVVRNRTPGGVGGRRG